MNTAVPIGESVNEKLMECRGEFKKTGKMFCRVGGNGYLCTVVSNTSCRRHTIIYIMGRTKKPLPLLEDGPLFHGSNVKVENPKILVSGFYKDFGFGFYCTNIEKQAQKWAMTKRGASVVSVYRYSPDDELKALSFPVMTDEWLDFVVACRLGVRHGYDIVEGPMADDQIWDYVEDFIEGTITREAFWVLAKFKYPTHQIVFCTQKALQSIVYERSYSV